MSRSDEVSLGETIFPQDINAIRKDATASGILLAHQQLGALAIGTQPTNTKTITLTVNGTAIVLTAVSAIGSTAGNFLIGATDAATLTNLMSLLANPGITNATQVALTNSNQQLLSYLDFALVGTTITICSLNSTMNGSLTSFACTTTITSATYTAQAMQLFVEPGVCYVNGTEVYFAGGSTPTVTAPSSHPRIDVLTIDSTGTLAWTTGAENASPTVPAYPANKVPICELLNVVGETSLLDNTNFNAAQGWIQNDVRPFVQPPFTPGSAAYSFIPDGDGTRDLGSTTKEWNNIYAKSGIFLNNVAINSLQLSGMTAGMTLAAGDPLCVVPYSTTAVGYDTSTSSSGSGLTITQSVTVASNSNRILIVFTATSNASFYTITGITYAGVAMTQLGTAQAIGANTGKFQIWYLLAPATGANNLIISNSNAGNAVGWNVYSYYNVQQIAPEAFAQSSSGAGNAASTLTALTNGGLLLGCIAGLSNAPSGTMAANHVINNTAGGLSTGDGGTQYPPVPQTISGSTGGSQNVAGGSVSLAPIQTSVAPRVYKTSTAQAITSNAFVGFAQAVATVGTTVTVATGGVDQNQTGLTIGAQYYLSDTIGTLSISPGTITRKVGVATDTNKILITNIW